MSFNHKNITKLLIINFTFFRNLLDYITTEWNIEIAVEMFDHLYLDYTYYR